MQYIFVCSIKELRMNKVIPFQSMGVTLCYGKLDKTRGLNKNYNCIVLDQMDQHQPEGKTLDFRYVADGTCYEKHVSEIDSKVVAQPEVTEAEKSFSSPKGRNVVNISVAIGYC